MGWTTRDKILDTAISATSGLTAVLAIAILLSPGYTSDVVVIGAIVLLLQLILEWRESPPGVHSEPDED